MNKPIQILEVSSQLTPASTGVANKGQNVDGEDSFSRVLSRNKSEPTATESGQTLPEPGKKLPEQSSQSNNQKQSTETAPAVASQGGALNRATVDSELLQQAGTKQPHDPVVQNGLQQAIQASLLKNEENGSLIDVGVEDQAQDASGLAIANETIQLSSGVAGVQGNLPVPNGLALQQTLDESGELTEGYVSSRTSTDGGRPATVTDSVGNAVREAVQSAIASQVSNNDSRQSLQQNRSNQSAGNTLPAANSLAANASPFLQALTESTMTMPSTRVQVPVGQQGWGEAVGQQVAWFISQKVSSASMRLNPQHLGPMEMAVSMDGDKASVTFTSQHAIVREALELSLPRLRDMLSENGLNLTNVNVSQQGESYRNGDEKAASQQGADAANDDNGTSEPVMDERRMTVHTQGLVDFYA